MGVADLDSTVPDIYLYVNGVLVDSVIDVAGITFWGNGDGSGLGTVNGNTATSNTSNFEGEIAVFQLYESALNATQIQNNFESIDQAAGPAGLTSGGLNTTGTAGLVALNADGSFDYDPNGQFVSLGHGVTATDTFSYTANDGTTTDAATVTITVTGVNYAPTDISLSSATAVENVDGAVIGRALFEKTIDLGEALDVAQPEPEPVAAFQ